MKFDTKWKTAIRLFQFEQFFQLWDSRFVRLSRSRIALSKIALLKGMLTLTRPFSGL